MTSINQRIKAFLRQEGITVNALARRLGVHQQTLHNYVECGRAPSYDFIDKLLTAFPDLSAEWLVRGSGDMLLLSGATKQNQIVSFPHDFIQLTEISDEDTGTMSIFIRKSSITAIEENQFRTVIADGIKFSVCETSEEILSVIDSRKNFQT